MEYSPLDLKKVLTSVKHGTKLNEDQVIAILYNLLCNLKFMHKANLVHRDLKPANILMNE